METKYIHPLRRLLMDNKKYWPGLILLVLLLIPSGILKTLIATYWGAAVDLGVSGHINEMLTNAFWMLIFIATDGVRTIFVYTTVGQVMERMFANIRARMFAALTVADTATMEKEMRSGDLAFRACDDVEQLCDTISDNFTRFGQLIFQATFAMIACIIISWQLSIAYFLMLPVSLWLLSKVSARLERLWNENRDNSGQSANIISGALSGIHATKVFKMEQEMTKRYLFHIDEAYKRTKYIERIGMKITMIRYVATVLQTLVLFIVGTWLVGQGLITIGNVIAFVALAFWVTEAFENVDWMIFSFKFSIVLSRRIQEVFDLKEESSGEECVQENCTEFVRFSDVDFSYNQDGNKQNILNGLNLVVKQGQKVAIVGQSGSGKSTVIRLICRLFGHDGGNITMFGRQGEKVDLDSLRGKLALVTQEPALFEDSIFENVRYGRKTATEEEVIDALNAADLLEFVSSLPNGIHTKLGEFGSRLSGGQRQRLSIARAFIKNAELVLLDEATSALDTRSEAEIQKNIDILIKDRAAVIVAHRLTTVQNADYIYCLQNGTVIEEGSPSELYEKGGYYYDMCKMQEVVVN